MRAVTLSLVSPLQADATTLNSTLLPPTDFANTFVAAVGRGQGPQVARALAFLINGNMTYGGGCPAARTTAENSKVGGLSSPFPRVPHLFAAASHAPSVHLARPVNLSRLPSTPLAEVA